MSLKQLLRIGSQTTVHVGYVKHILEMLGGMRGFSHLWFFCLYFALKQFIFSIFGWRKLAYISVDWLPFVLLFLYNELYRSQFVCFYCKYQHRTKFKRINNDIWYSLLWKALSKGRRGNNFDPSVAISAACSLRMFWL